MTCVQNVTKIRIHLPLDNTFSLGLLLRPTPNKLPNALFDACAKSALQKICVRFYTSNHLSLDRQERWSSVANAVKPSWTKKCFKSTSNWSMEINKVKSIYAEPTMWHYRKFRPTIPGRIERTKKRITFAHWKFHLQD